MGNHFRSYHPILNFIYLAGVIIFSMFLMHPVFLVISFTLAFIYSVWLSGSRALKFNLLLLPLLVLVALINPAFNHEGATILFYLFDNPITLESIYYGVASSLMFGAVIMWFSCYNVIMTSDKFIYLFGKIIPALSLILSMVLRFVPKFKAQIKVISRAQRCVGRDISNGTLLERAHAGMTIVSIMTTWALETAIETADSMKSRGYGLPGRTSFSLFRFSKRDWVTLGCFSLLIAVIVLGIGLRLTTVTYFPWFKVPAASPLGAVIFIAYILFCAMPLILDGLEELTWRRLQLKI